MKYTKFIKRLFRKIQARIKSNKQAASSTAASAAIPVNTRPTRNFAEFFEHVRKLGFCPRTIIDVGAARGTPDLYRSFPEAYVILFEPLPDFVPDMKKILSQRSGEYHTCALMSEAGRSTILKSPDKFGSSMMHRIENNGDERLVPVDVRTLDEIVGSRHEEPMILKTDCQGGDFDVIKGGERTLDRCEIVVMEVSFFQFWGSHHPRPLEILNYMNDKGFVLYDFLDGLFRPLDNALGQIDMVFVRDKGMFRKNHEWGSPPS